MSEQKITVNGTEYTVVSHYMGKKDLDVVLRALAEKRAYEDITKMVG